MTLQSATIEVPLVLSCDFLRYALVITLFLSTGVRGHDSFSLDVRPAGGTSTPYAWASGDLKESLEKTPSLFLRPQGYLGQTNFVSFRGLDGVHTSVFLDGIVLNQAASGQTDFSHFLSLGSEKLRVLSGPENVLYTNQAAGIFLIETPFDIENSGSFETGSFKTFKLGARSTTLNPMVTHVVIGNHQETGGLPQYGNQRIYGERNRYINDNAGIISLFNLGPGTSLKTQVRVINSTLKYDSSPRPLPSKPQGTQNATIPLFGMELHHDSSTTDHFLKATYAGQNLNYGAGSFSTTQEASIRYHSATHWKNSNKTHWTCDMVSTNLKGQEELNRRRNLGGVSFLHSIKVKERWTIEVGGRQEIVSHYTLSPCWTSGIAWSNQGTKFYGSWRQAFRLPTLFDLYAKNPFSVPNTALKKETLDLWELGWKQQWQKKCYFQMVYFYTQKKSMIVSTPVSENRSTFTNLNHSAILQGMEFSINQKILDVALRLTYVLTSTGYPKNVLKSSVPKHRWSLGGEISPWENWTILAQLQYVGFRYGRSAKISDYFLGDLELLYALGLSWKIYGQVKNVGNTTYESTSGYRSPRRAFYVGMRCIL